MDVCMYGYLYLEQHTKQNQLKDCSYVFEFFLLLPHTLPMTKANL